MSDLGRLTRREALSGAAAAATGAGALFARAGGARAAEDRGAGGVFAHPLGSLVPGCVITVRPGRRFALVALAWAAPAHPRVEIRTRPTGVPGWGPWAPAATTGHDGDGVRETGHLGEGMWSGPADAVQVRSAEEVRGASLRFVEAEPGLAAAPAAAAGSVGTATADARARARGLARAHPVLPAGPGQPPIIARAAWAGAGQRPTRAFECGAVEMAFVHHTENPNGYGPDAVPAMLRAIYAFHVHGRGWWDIGYNFLVDAFGRIWEGREGGIDLPIIGAQAGDWNTLSSGVAMLGTYSGVAPSPAALAALERLLAWKLSLHGVPVRGQLQAVVSPTDVVYTQFRAGEHVRLPRIAGHRDGDATACPGDALYDRLPGIRDRATRLAGDPARLTIAPVLSELVTGPSLTVRGRLARLGGSPVAGAPIAVQLVGRSDPLATATTDHDGRWSATFVPRQGGLLRAVHRARPAAVSGVIPLQRA